VIYCFLGVLLLSAFGGVTNHVRQVDMLYRTPKLLYKFQPYIRTKRTNGWHQLDWKLALYYEVMHCKEGKGKFQYSVGVLGKITRNSVIEVSGFQ